MDSGHVAVGGHTSAASLHIAPTVLTDVAPDSTIMQEEIFGPILPIVRAETLDDAIRLIRAGDKPLAAYIFTKDRAAESRFLESVSSGNACVNDTMMFMAVEELPFGGVGAVAVDGSRTTSTAASTVALAVGEASTVVSMATLAVRASTVASMAALAVRAGPLSLQKD